VTGETGNIFPGDDNFDVAIVGMACRFPGAENVDEYWKNLCSGLESISFFSDEELLESGIAPDILKSSNYVKASAVLNNPGLFDASFFNFSPREARTMDPQHRILLECAYEALENAGYDPDRFNGSIGIFAGSSMNTYLLFSGMAAKFLTEQLPVLIGNDKDFLSTRISYKLNLRGPSVTVQSACSTSLVATHMACQSLLNQECDMALAGGVSIRVPHRSGYFCQNESIFSPDGHCRAFDHRAQGTVFGSGAGIVVLRRLSDAFTDGDHIYAVIKGSAINNDGSSKVDYTAPSVDQQSAAIVEAISNAGIDANTITYVEAHGTGTTLGDPIEVAALTKAFRNFTKEKGFCALGSVKTNLGHLDAAAGVASLIKTALALENKAIPATLHFERPNPEINFEKSPFFVNSDLLKWNRNSQPRRAGINSLGVGGTNVHVILEEAPEPEERRNSRSSQLLLLSARSQPALVKTTENLLALLEQGDSSNLADVAYTLQVGRKSFEHRRALVCRNVRDAVTVLRNPDSKRLMSSSFKPTERDVIFLFPGQGSQYVNMGLELFRAEPVFRKEVDHCSEILKSYLKIDLRDIVYPAEVDRAQLDLKLKQTEIAQPALFTMEYALAKLWMSWGIHPCAMAGHSIGEYVAACLAGVFSFEDALVLVATRGRLMQGLPGGLMLAVMLAENDIQPYLGKDLSLAAVNAPTFCVVSGKKSAVENLKNRLATDNVTSRYLHTSHAFHSAMMDPIIGEFAEQVKRVNLNSPEIPMASNVTGSWMTPEQAVDPKYWILQLRQTVRFSDCIQVFMEDPDAVFLEVGPGHTLVTLARQQVKQKDRILLSSLRHPGVDQSDVTFILETLGKLWLSGIEVDWKSFYGAEKRCRVPLPYYPFEHRHYWFDSESLTADLITKSSILDNIEADTQLNDQPIDRTDPSSAGDSTLQSELLDAENEVEKIIATIWQKVLGVGEINIDDNFFDLGGSSLGAVQVFDRVENRFGRRLPLATLYEAPTIRELANLLSEKKLKSSWGSLVKIQDGNSRPPLFCMHSSEGNVLEYNWLAKQLGPEQPVYGLQAIGLEGTEIISLSVEDIASRFVEDIKTVQPTGPYYLSGYCLGGLIAGEMTYQLQASGEKVAFLALISTSTPDHLKQTLPDIEPLQKLYYRIAERTGLELENLCNLRGKAKLLYLRDKIRQLNTFNRIKLEGCLDFVFSKLGLGYNWHSRDYVLKKSVEFNNKAYFDYKPHPIENRVYLFRVSKSNRALLPDPYLGWRDFFKEELRVFEVYGYHKNILKQPNVIKLSEKFNEYLKQAQDSNSH
jgi:acyl transferase domain-containing protein/thioesterase domain-containing protein